MAKRVIQVIIEDRGLTIRRPLPGHHKALITFVYQNHDRYSA
jgi:hypothetical protein